MSNYDVTSKVQFALIKRSDDSMVYSIDYWLSETIPPMIEELRKHKGYPGMMVTEDIESLSQDMIDDICTKKWNDILDQIIDAFKSAQMIADGGPAWDEYFDEYHRLHSYCQSIVDWSKS